MSVLSERKKKKREYNQQQKKLQLYKIVAQ